MTFDVHTPATKAMQSIVTYSNVVVDVMTSLARLLGTNDNQRDSRCAYVCRQFFRLGVMLSQRGYVCD